MQLNNQIDGSVRMESFHVNTAVDPISSVWTFPEIIWLVGKN